MKKIISIYIFLFTGFTVTHAQSTSWNKTRIAPTLLENFQFISKNKNIKNGEAFILDINNKELGRGNYKENKKDSIWNYFSQSGELIQVYDYTNKKIIYNFPDESTIVKSRYELDTIGLINAKITKPLKIGGLYYGFNLLYNQRNLPKEVKDQKESVLMEYVFSISETGKMETFSINYSSTFYNAVYPQSIKGLYQDAYEFMPATINGNPVKSKLVYQIMLYINPGRDLRTYNIPTQNGM